jgi:uncharacterized low-complexity protein
MANMTLAALGLATSLSLSAPAVADCLKERSGQIICGGGPCLRDVNGEVTCAQFRWGSVLRTSNGETLCGKGRCVRTLNGEVICSAVEGGAVVKESDVLPNSEKRGNLDRRR